MSASAAGRGAASGLVLPVVYANVVLYALCYQLQSPVEPFLVARLAQGDDSRAYSRVQAWFSAIQTAGSFVVGFLLDRFGLRGAFVVNFAAAALSYALLANATSLEILYISKVPTLCMHGFLCAQATVSKCTTGTQSRVAALGRLTACYTVGATLGPALGGYLGANVDHYFGAKLAVAGSLLSALLSFLFIPEQLQGEGRQSGSAGSATSDGEAAVMGLAERVRTVVAAAYELLALKMVTGVANSMTSTAMPLILKNSFDFREGDMGLAQAAMTFVTALCNAFLLGPLAATLGSVVNVIKFCMVGTMVGLMTQAGLIQLHALTATAFIVCRLFLNLFQFVLSSNLTAESTGRVTSDLKGSLLGTEHALFSAVRVFSPSMAVTILNGYGVLGLTLSSAGIYASATVLWVLSGSAGDGPRPKDDAAKESKKTS